MPTYEFNKNVLEAAGVDITRAFNIYDNEKMQINENTIINARIMSEYEIIGYDLNDIWFKRPFTLHTNNFLGAQTLYIGQTQQRADKGINPSLFKTTEEYFIIPVKDFIIETTVLCAQELSELQTIIAQNNRIIELLETQNKYFEKILNHIHI